MKRFSSILLAALVATLMLVSNVRAQQYTGTPTPSDWQNALLTWNTPTFPGQLNDNTIAIVNSPPPVVAAATLTNCGGVPNRVRALQINSVTAVTLQGTGTLVIGALNINSNVALTIGPGLNVVIDSIIDGAAGSTISVLAGGTLTLRKGANAPAQQVLLGGTTLAVGTINSSVVIENGFNGGNFPTNIFYAVPPALAATMTYTGNITVNGNTNLGENITTLGGGGILTVNSGVLQVTPGATLELRQTAANSLQGTGTLNAAVGGNIILGNSTAGAAFNAAIVPAQRLSNPYTGTLTLSATQSYTVNSDLTFSPPNPVTAQQSVLNMTNAAGNFIVPAGVTVRFNNTINNAIQGAGQVLINAGGTVVLGEGFNAGVVPAARFSTINGTLRTVGPLSLNVTGNPNPFAATGQFEIGGDLTLAGGGQLEFSQTSPNSVRAINNARIISPGFNTGVQFNANSNNGVLPGCLFGNPYSGYITIRSSMVLSCDLSMATDAGPINFDATTVGAAANIILTVNPNVTLALRQQVGGRMTAALAGAPVESPLLCYIQGANNTSRVVLGLGANGGTVPGANPLVAPPAAPVVPFLPLSGVTTFNGRLVLEGSLTLAANLAMGTGSVLDLASGNLTVQATRTLRLLNSGSNSLIGTGFLQAIAPTANSYRHNGNGNVAFGSTIEIGTSMNGTIFPAARFASPFQGNIDFSTAGSITVQGDFVHAVPGGQGYFVVGDVQNGVSTANITIAANSSVRLNAITPSSLFGSAIYNPPVPAFPGGSFQGIDQTSRLVLGVGHAGGINALAFTTTGTWLANPFNGTLAFASSGIIFTSATIGLPGGLELGGNVSVISGGASIGYGGGNSTLTATIGAGGGRGMFQHPHDPVAGPTYYSPITITLNNQAPGSISGLGTFLTATGNTLVFGSGANGGIIPGNRLASPHFGTIATVSAMTLQGNLTIGDLRDGFRGRTAGAATVDEFHSSGYLKLGDLLTIDNNAVLTVSNATAQPFSTRFGGNADAFQVSTNGTGFIQANPNGELRILDGFNSRNSGNSSGYYVSIAGAQAVAGGANRASVSNFIPTLSFFHPGFLASPFNGKLFFGSDMPQDAHATLAARSFTGGFSRFNITTGTLRIGTTGFLGLISPLIVSSGTAQILAAAAGPSMFDGYPRVILEQTGANSFVGTTTGSFIQSSTGNFGGLAPTFNMARNHGNAIGGSISLGVGFNGGIIPASVFANPFAGRLNMPNAAGTLNLVGTLNMNSSYNPLAMMDFGVLNLGNVNHVLNVQDGSTLSLGTTGTIVGNIITNYSWGSGVPNGSIAAYTVAELATFQALQGAGRIQGGGNNARVIIPGNMNDGYITGANFAVPFNGRMVISTGNSLPGADANAGYSRMFLVGNLTFGAVGSNNGVLEIQAPTYVATNLTNQIAPELVLAAPNNAGLQGGASVTFNNISPVSVVLPGNGVLVATTNIGRVIIGPNALGNILPAAQLRQPFVGQLIVTSGSTAPYALNVDLRLAQDRATTPVNAYGEPGVQNGYLRTFADINIASLVTLGIQNTAIGAITGTGVLQGASASSTVRFLSFFGMSANNGKIGKMAGPVLNNGAAVAGSMSATLNAATVETGGFAEPFNGTIQTDMAQNNGMPGGDPVAAPVAANPTEPKRNVYHLYGRVVLGAPGSSNGVLNASGATIYVAGADLAGPTVAQNALIRSTVGNLVINNISALATAFPGAGRVTPKGLTNGAAVALNGNPAPLSPSNDIATAGLNGSIVFGPSALGGNFPSDRFTALPAIGTAIANDQRNEAPWNAEVRGTIMTSTGTMTATSSTLVNLTFANGGSLLVGGPDLRYATSSLPTTPVSTLATLVVPNNTVYTINTTHRLAFGGNGALLLGTTNATLAFGPLVAGIAPNEGVLYGENLGVHNNGSFDFNFAGSLDLRGTLRQGAGGRDEGRIRGITAGGNIVIGTSATLDLRMQTLRVGGNTPTLFGFIRAIGTTATSSVLIFGPDYGRFLNGNVAPAGTILINGNNADPVGNIDTRQGRINQDLPLLNTSVPSVAASTMGIGFGGTIITSTGSIAVTNGNLSISGALEMGGILNLEGVAGGQRTYAFNNWGANSFRRTDGSDGQLRANPDGLGTAVNNGARVVLGPTTNLNTATVPLSNSPAVLTQYSFNGGVLPANLLGRSNGNTGAPVNGLPIDGIGTNLFGATRGTAQLDINGSNLTLSGGNLYMFGDLNFTALGGDLRIPAATQLTINGGFAQAAGQNRGVITAANNTATLAFAAAARLNGAGGTFDQTQGVVGPLQAGNTLDANSPQIGGRDGLGFTGTLRQLSSNFDESALPAYAGSPVNVSRSNLGISGITVTIASAGIIDMQSTRSTIVFRAAGSRLNLNNTGVNSYLPSFAAAIANGTLREATTSIISLQAPTGAVATQAFTSGTVSFGAGFNGGVVPGNILSAYRLQAGSAFIMNSNLNLGSDMFVSTNGTWNFNSGTNKLTLGASNMTVHSPVQNANQDRYFVTDGVGVVGLNGIGNVTFPVGPTSALYTPINIVNNAQASLFSVGARPRTVTVPPANTGSNAVLASVNAQWNVTQNNNVAQGVAVLVSPQWPSSLEGAGFNRQIASVNRYSGATIAQTSTPAPGTPVSGLTNYFTSTLVVSQAANPGLLVSSPIIVTSQPQPAISSFSPASGFTGSVITIVGQRFTGVTAVTGVTFGGTPAASFTVSTGGDTIRAVVGSGATGNVVVTQAGGTASLGTFTYLGMPPTTPVITSALPQPIPAGLGDAVVTIRGTGFGRLAVRVNATGSGLTGSLIPTSNSDSVIVVNIPGQFSRNIGSITLQVVSSDRNPVSTTVPVAAAPTTTLTGISPAASTSGNLAAHTLELTGTAFGPQSIFSLNGVPLNVVGFTNNPNGTSTARVLVPAGVTSGDIVVTNLNNTTGRIPYAVNGLPRPVITSVNPLAILPGSPTTRLTVTGQNFIPGAVVTFNGQPLTTASVSATSIAFDVPANLLAQPDLATIRIVNPDNQVIGYRFPISTTVPPGGSNPLAPQVPVDSLGRPLSGSITPATTTATVPATAFQLTINGSNFSTGTTVSLGGIPLTIVSVTGTRIVANVPASANVAGMAQLQLANGTATTNLPYTITGTVNPPSGVPTVSGIAQNRNTVVINGSNFAPGATVTFGPNNTPLTVVPGTDRLVATLPSPTPDGNYTVTVTNPGANGGSVTRQVAITSVSTERLAATRVYPNPTVDVVNVEVNLDRASTVVINVTNTLGQVVMTVRTNASAGFFAKSINVANLPSGAYTIEVTDGTRRSIEKIIKN